MSRVDAFRPRSASRKLSKHSPRLVLFGALIALLIVTGCGPDDDNGVKIIDDPDAGITDTGDAGETDVDDVFQEEPIDPTHCPPSPSTVEVSQPAPYEFDEWIVAAPDDQVQVFDAIFEGEFEVPADGDFAYGTSWEAVEPGEDGEVDDGVFGDVHYAAVEISVDSRTHAFARADDVFQVFVNGHQLPGDVYGHGTRRIPIPLEPGDNTVVLRYSVQQTPEFELFTTPDEIFFNTQDLTDPHLRAGTRRVEQLGVPVLNLAGLSLTEVEAQIAVDENFGDTTVEHPALGAGAATQVAFVLDSKRTWSADQETVPVTLRLDACQLEHVYEIDLELEVVGENETFKRTYRSPVDNSVQYYGVTPPSDFSPHTDYALALSMHGASVEAISQAGQYTQKDWMYVIAPTNRRPFGFDWEEWGRLNALTTLEHAKESFNIDETRVYATGHSMGGHGTWHMGVMHPGLFATIGPSAGWSTFYSYGGADEPTDLIRPARAHSDTYRYMSNLADRGAYLLHGDADNNVPISEAHDLYDALTEYTDDVEFHIEEGADHWWDGDASEGQDCVDWPAMFQFFYERTLDPTELDFHFITPGQWIYAEHSYVRLLSTENPFEDAVFVSERIPEETDDDNDENDNGGDDNGDNGGDENDNGGENDGENEEIAFTNTVELTTENVRAMDIDADALSEKGIEELVVDGESHDVTAGGTIEIGPREGKNPDAPGLLNPTFHRPFCFVYPDDDSEILRGVIANLLTNWALRGNGHGCALPLELLTDDIAESRNLIYVGVDFEQIPGHEDRPFQWDDESLSVGSYEYDGGAGFVTFPRDGHQSAAFIATDGYERSLYLHMPFTSRAGMPDFFLWDDGGGLAGGYFDSNWEFEENLSAGQ